MNQKKDEASTAESVANECNHNEVVNAAKSQQAENQNSTPESTVSEKSAQTGAIEKPPLAKQHSPEQATLSADSQQTSTQKVSKLAILALVLVLCLGAGASYGVKYYVAQQQDQQAVVSDLIDKQAALIRDVEAKLLQQQQANESLNQALNTRVNDQLSNQEQVQILLNQKVAELSGRRPNDWLLAEANYLVTMAGRKLWQEKDQKTAAALLVTADKRIAEMHDQSLITLRQALAKDIATLSALPQDKSQNIALALDGLITQIDNLKLNTVTLPDAVSESIQTTPHEEDTWKNNLLMTWYAFIDGFIKVRKREGDIVPLMSVKQKWYLEENLKNKLVQAQLAVYRQQQQAFTSAIEVSRTWVLQFFDREDSATTFMLDELTKLEKASIEVNYPRDLLSRNLIADEIVRRNIASAQVVEQ